ncbi:MAG: hypothetical protein ABH869_04765 [Candidatus Omnitrophota bacterium]
MYLFRSNSLGAQEANQGLPVKSLLAKMNGPKSIKKSPTRGKNYSKIRMNKNFKEDSDILTPSPQKNATILRKQPKKQKKALKDKYT